MEIILSIIGIVIIGLVLFVMTGLFGWAIHYLGGIVGFLAQGSWGCIGYLLKFLVPIFIIIIIIGFLLNG